MPTATPPTPVTIIKAGPLPDQIVQSIVARLAALNSTDPTIIALLAEWQAATGQPLS
jgi:hypothetical protein